MGTEQDLRYNPAHPSHSVISLWGLFQSAKLVAFTPDTAIDQPVRTALTAPRADGLSYRRIDLFRPPIFGAPVSSAPQRPFPQYRLAWAPSPDQSLRVPLSGEVYLPLDDGDYSFWAVPRSEDPATALPSKPFRLSVRPPPPAKAIGLPADVIVVDLSSSRARPCSPISSRMTPPTRGTATRMSRRVAARSWPRPGRLGT